MFLIKGYPSYFTLQIDIQEFLKDPSTKFPLSFKMYKPGLDDYRAKFIKGGITYGTSDYYERLELKKLEAINVFISTKNRLPTK